MSTIPENTKFSWDRCPSSHPSEPSTVSTPGFADSEGNNIWGEPSFDQSEEFILMTRFNTSDSDCWTPDLILSWGDVESGFDGVTNLN